MNITVVVETSHGATLTKTVKQVADGNSRYNSTLAASGIVEAGNLIVNALTRLDGTPGYGRPYIDVHTDQSEKGDQP